MYFKFKILVLNFYLFKNKRTYFLCSNNAISVCTFMYSCAILQCCSNTAMDSLEFGHGARGWKESRHVKTSVSVSI